MLGWGGGDLHLRLGHKSNCAFDCRILLLKALVAVPYRSKDNSLCDLVCVDVLSSCAFLCAIKGYHRQTNDWPVKCFVFQVYVNSVGHSMQASWRAVVKMSTDGGIERMLRAWTFSYLEHDNTRKICLLGTKAHLNVFIRFQCLLSGTTHVANIVNRLKLSDVYLPAKDMKRRRSLFSTKYFNAVGCAVERHPIFRPLPTRSRLPECELRFLIKRLDEMINHTINAHTVDPSKISSMGAFVLVVESLTVILQTGKSLVADPAVVVG